MTQAQNYWLVIDQGGHGTRAMVFNAKGDILRAAHAALPTLNPQSGWFEQETHLFAASIRDCLQQLEAMLRQEPLSIHSAALITQRSSLVACKKDSLQAITPVISWQDTRHQQWLQQKINHRDFDISLLKQMTGLRLNAHYGASKMRWLLDNHNAVQQAAKHHNLLFLPLAAYVTHMLTGNSNTAVDAVSASRTFLVELAQEDWSATLLSLFDIDKSMLPAIVPSRHTFGNVTLAGQVIPLQVVGGDQSFLPFAYGKMALSHAMFINAGTGAFVQTELAPQDVPSALLCSLAILDQQQAMTVAEGTVNACASALDWLWQQEQQTLSIIEIEKALHTTSSPPVFYHRITALGSPYWLAAGVSTFSEHASLEAKAVAVIESIVFLLTINIGLLLQAKPGLSHILVSGGIAKSDGFCQKLANCTRLPVFRHQDHEASARGTLFYLANIDHYHPEQEPSRFQVQTDTSLLVRYRHFDEWLRQEWLKPIDS